MSPTQKTTEPLVGWAGSLTTILRLRGEVFHEGEWIEDRTVVNALVSPGYLDLLTLDEAKEVASRLGIPVD